VSVGKGKLSELANEQTNSIAVNGDASSRKRLQLGIRSLCSLSRKVTLPARLPEAPLTAEHLPAMKLNFPVFRNFRFLARKDDARTRTRSGTSINLYLKGNQMKKSGKAGGGQAKTTPEAATRVQRVVAQKNHGVVPADSVAARMAAAAAKNFGKSGVKKPSGLES